MLTITRKHLTEAFKAASEAAASKSPLPILTHIRLQAKANGDSVTLTGSDMHMTVQSTVPADVEDAKVDICLPADKIGALTGMAADTIYFDLDKKKVVARAGKCRLTLPTLPGKDFPEIKLEGEPSAVFHAPGLAAVIPTVLFAVAGTYRVDKPLLRNLWIEFDGAAVHLVACDGFMLAANSMQISPTEFGEEVPNFGIGIPSDAADLLSPIRLFRGAGPNGETRVQWMRPDGAFVMSDIDGHMVGEPDDVPTLFPLEEAA